MSNFVDECQLNVRGGDGGAGAVSFRREAHTPKGGPDGGDGGKGGDVWLVADRNVSSLLAFRDHPHRRARSGVHGRGKAMHGASGSDLEVAVPVGTVVADRDGEVLADLVTDGDRYLAAEGGRGGRGNARFLSNRRRAPSFAEQGEEGQEHWLRLELRLMADVALVGYPNVGKSTLIARISAAKPKIADYPFTTLEPNLGVVRIGRGGATETEFTVADIPGLVEGAADGRGLGHRFLRHVERARVLVLLLDLAGAAGAVPAPDEQRRVLLAELGAYRPELLTRPRIEVGSRADLLDADEVSVEDLEALDHLISGVTGEGVSALVGQMATAVEGVRAIEPEPEAYAVYRPIPAGVSVDRVGEGEFVVTGRQAERAVALSDLTNLEALDHAHSMLRKLGVIRALQRAGAREGDVVRIGSLEFAYEDDEV